MTSAASPPPAPASLTLTDLAADWEMVREPTAETARQMRVITHDLSALSHLTDARALAPRHLRAFRDDLLAHHRRPTARKMFGLAHALLEFGVHEALLDTNPAHGMTLPSSPPATPPHAPFTPSELTRLFTHRVFTARELPPQGGAGGIAAYWLPLLLLCSGVRLDTAAALRTDHLLYSADLPAVPYWRFDTPPYLEYRQPVHPILCRLGLLDYVAGLPPGHDLFPLLTPDRAGRRTAGFSTYFSRLLRREVGIVDPGKVAVSLRLNFALACREAELSHLHRCALLGSPLPDEWTCFGVDLPLAVLQKGMLRLSFPGFPL